MGSVTTVDLMAQADAEAALLELAPEGVVRDVTGPYWVLRHADVERLAHHPDVLGVGLSFFDLMGIGDGPLRRWYGSLMFTTEGQQHHRLRRLVSKAFTLRAVEALRASTRELVDAEVAALVADGGGDLAAQLRYVPMKAMCRLLGVPAEDVPTFAAWTDALSPTFGVMTPEQVEAAGAAIVALLAYVDELVAHRREDPADDLVTALLAAEDAGDVLEHGELLDMVANLLVGGHDTTAGQIGCTLHFLHAHPEAMAAVVAHPELVASAVSETIRLESSIPAIPRTTTAPIEAAGVEMEAGSIVLLSTGVANRERGVWKDPDTFVIDRFAQADTPRLLSFGIGTHYCLGAHLARLTLEEVVAGTAGRFELTVDPADIEWRMVLGRSPSALPVRTR